MNQQMLEEFFRINGHLPEWKEEKESWQNYVNAVGGCPEFTPEFIEETALSTLRYIKHIKQRAMPAQTALADFMGTSGDRVYMATINYPDKFTEYSWMNTIINNIKEKDWVKKIAWVHEYHTASGNHPHTHMIMTLHKKKAPSKLAQDIYGVKGVKKYCEGENFVQVEKDTSRTWTDRMAYITGDKKEDKLNLCELDREWRDTNKI